MSAYRVTFFFEANQQGVVGTGASVGWTESWYKNADKTIDQIIEDADITKYIVLRTACLASIYKITFVRVSDEQYPRRFKIRTIYSGGGSVRANPQNSHGQVQCAILIDLEKLPETNRPTEGVHHRRFLVRGLPSSVIDGNILDTNSLAWGNFNKFFDFIGNHLAGVRPEPDHVPFTWGIRFLSPNSTKRQILAARAIAPLGHQIEMKTDGNLPIFVGSRVIVSGIDSPAGFNRTWTVMKTDAPEPFPYIMGTSRRRLQGSYDGPGKGKAVVPVYEYGPVSQYAIIGLRNKKTGRVFRQLRGRSSAR